MLTSQRGSHQADAPGIAPGPDRGIVAATDLLDQVPAPGVVDTTPPRSYEEHTGEGPAVGVLGGVPRPRVPVEMTHMSDVLHAAAGATGEAAMAGDTRALTAVGAALQVLDAGAERIAVLGAIEHAAAVVAKLGSPATQRALRRVLAEIDACSRAGTHTSVELRHARVEGGVVGAPAGVGRGHDEL